MKNIFILLICVPIFIYSTAVRTQSRPLGNTTVIVKSAGKDTSGSTAANGEEQKTTIVVSSTGKSIEEAKNNALRSAIEQSFGAFISSKTEVLNDQLKDEIVSISNGNIHSYTLISQVEIPRGGYAVTLETTISVTQLVSFVTKKGIEVEFKGSLFGAEIRQQNLNESAEVVAIKNICFVAKGLLKESLDYNLEVSEPEIFSDYQTKNQWIVPLKVVVTANANYESFKQYFVSNLQNLAMSKNEIEKYEKRKKSYHQFEINEGSPIPRNTMFDSGQPSTKSYNRRSKNQPDDQTVLFFRSTETKRKLHEFFTTSNYWLTDFVISNDIDTIAVRTNNIYNSGHTGLNIWHLNNNNERFDHWKSKNNRPGFPNFSFEADRYKLSTWYFYMDSYIYPEYNFNHFTETHNPYSYGIGKLFLNNIEYIHKYKAAYTEEQLMKISKFIISRRTK
tara:strand:- start:1402 stop:2745 length:1344 start_codon:yes stop_codon:yes gene_type:complete